MANPADIAKRIEKAVEDFNKALPSIDKKILSDIEVLLKDLDVKNGSIKANARNVRMIAAIKQKIEREILQNKAYKKNLKKYLAAFEEITKLQNQYFEEIAKEYKQPKLLDALRQEAKSAAYESLTRAGVTQNISKPIQDILRVNITTGAKYSDMVKTIKTSLDGKLQRYAGQITTDALNQYSAQYSNLVTNDLDLEWFQYTGAIIQTSRPFCKALHEKKYVHKSELPKVVSGDFKEFDGRINPKTGLPEGMIEGTNASNFMVYRGGWNCGHQLVPVSDLSVPASFRDVFK